MAYTTQPTYLKDRKGVWYFQRGVPKEFQGSIGKTIWQKSLKTGDIRQAQRLVLPFILETDQKIEHLSDINALGTDPV